MKNNDSTNAYISYVVSHYVEKTIKHQLIEDDCLCGEYGAEIAKVTNEKFLDNEKEDNY